MPADLPDLSFVDLSGPIAYRSWDGPDAATFVLVHGLGGSHLNWIPVAPKLAGLGRVVALDLPGFGWSPRRDRGSGVMDQRHAVSDLIAQVATGRVVVCGNSLGGMVAVLQAAVEPDSVDGVVLTGSVYPWVRGSRRPHPAVLGAFALYDLPAVGERFVDARVRRIDAERMVRLGFRMVTADPSTIPQELVTMNVDLARLRADDPEAPGAFLDAARSMLRLGRRRDAAARTFDRVRCPVLVLHGRHDRLVPAAFAEGTLDAHPEWRGRIFPDLGHVPQMEAPDRWFAEVADWFGALTE